MYVIEWAKHSSSRQIISQKLLYPHMNMIMHAPGNLENRNAPPNAHCFWEFSWDAKDFRSILTKGPSLYYVRVKGWVV